MTVKEHKYTTAPDILKKDNKSFNKLVNIIAYIIKLEQKKLYLTRLLKILYVIDENSVKKIGSPVTNLTYKVAEKGPLADHLWYCIQNNPELFGEYFDVKFNDSTASYSLTSKNAPDLDVLSDYEDNLIKETVKKYKGKDTEDIIEELHAEGTLWAKIKKKHNLNFDNPESSSISKYKIDFHELIKNDDFRMDAYQNYHSRKA
jgi:hypothetical protein